MYVGNILVINLDKRDVYWQYICYIEIYYLNVWFAKKKGMRHMIKNNESPVSQTNPLRTFMFGALVFITFILIRLILFFPPLIYDILFNFYSLAVSILFVVFYLRKMKYAWHSLLLFYIPLFFLYLYWTFIVRDTLSFIVSIVWAGVILVIINWRKRYFTYLEQEATHNQS